MQTLSKKEMAEVGGGMIPPLWFRGWRSWVWPRRRIVHRPISSGPLSDSPRPRPGPIPR